MNVNYEDLEPIIGAALKKANTANERIDDLPLPMVFKGTLGTGGTISTLPTASSENEGFVYIVITDGTYAGQTAKAGDTFVSDGSAWVLVPSADEPSVIDDTVTSTALTWSSSKIASELGGLVKTFTYTGNGNVVNTITFPTVPKVVFGIFSDRGSESNDYIIDCFCYGQPRIVNETLAPAYTSSTGPRASSVVYNSNEITITSDSAAHSVNTLDDTYTVYYI